MSSSAGKHFEYKVLPNDEYGVESRLNDFGFFFRFSCECIMNPFRNYYYITRSLELLPMNKNNNF